MTTKETAMGDVDDLARVISGHEWMPDEEACSCGWEGFEHPGHLAAAVLASGAVVSADKVQALADEMARFSEDYRRCPSSPAREAYRFAAVRLTTLLREPATDAAPTGKTQDGDERGVRVERCFSHPDASTTCQYTGGKSCACEARLDALEERIAKADFRPCECPHHDPALRHNCLPCCVLHRDRAVSLPESGEQK